ncbi:FRIGIDA-like protein 4a [Camellia lanceoleosa]|uniref:FRIGIDA-like protein 4a n=1 Tax=Camellia lanceoleosa TaxID=1840588 RepID=A0ACC0FN08_9ERIC|nr:FRIGIDA-like protein 4a [Camellia lanceoleosa]
MVVKIYGITWSSSYSAPGHSCTTMAYSADGTRLFSCGTSNEGESYIVEWNESKGAVKQTYHGLGKRSVGVVQFDTTKNRFLAAGDEFVIKFWNMDYVNLLTTTDAEGGLPVNTGGFMIELECLCTDMIEELINREQQVDAVHFTFKVGLEGKFPPIPLLKAFLNNAKKAADSILEDPNNSDIFFVIKAVCTPFVIKCVEEYKLEAEFPLENLRKRLDQLEKSKTEKKKPAVVPANKRTRVNNGGPMPPAKAGRSTNAYVSSFPAALAYVRSPSHAQYPVGVPSYPAGPAMYNSRSPPTNPYAYSPKAAPPLTGCYQVAPVNYSPYGGYGNVAPTYQQAYYR